MDNPVRCQQLDLLVRAANELDQGRLPPEVRSEVTRLLKRLIAECAACSGMLPGEVAHE
jgi:hypothetical protein